MKVLYGYRGKETDIEELVKEVGPGWAPLITQLVGDLIDLGWNRVVLQVKEKFGGLRFYTGNGTKEIFDLISTAEEKSFEICEHCGAPGCPRDLSWILTLCDSCYADKISK